VVKRALRSHDAGAGFPAESLEREQPGKTAVKRRRNDDNDGTLIHGQSPHPETGSGPVSVTELAERSDQVTRNFTQVQEKTGQISDKTL
jgi:hypothetical protein